MAIQATHLLRLSILNLRLVYHFLKFDIAITLISLLFIVFVREKIDISNLSLVLLMLFFLEPFFFNMAKGPVNILPHYVIGGVDIGYIFIANNSSALVISSTSILALTLGISVSSAHIGWRTLSPLAHFLVYIFPLITLGNYAAVIRMRLGLKKNDGMTAYVMRFFIHSLLVILSSIPHMLFQYLFSPSVSFSVTLLCSICIWYATIVYHIAPLARRNLFRFLETQH